MFGGDTLSLTRVLPVITSGQEIIWTPHPPPPYKEEAPAGIEAWKGIAKKTMNYSSTTTLTTWLLRCKKSICGRLRKPYKGQLGKKNEINTCIKWICGAEHMFPASPLLRCGLSWFHAGLYTGALSLRFGKCNSLYWAIYLLCALSTSSLSFSLSLILSYPLSLSCSPSLSLFVSSAFRSTSK